MKFTCTTLSVVSQPEVSSAAGDLIWPKSSLGTPAFSPDWAEGRTPGVSARHASTHHPLGKQAWESARSRGLVVELILIKNALSCTTYCYFDFLQLGLFLSSSLQLLSQRNHQTPHKLKTNYLAVFPSGAEEVLERK